MVHSKGRYTAFVATIRGSTWTYVTPPGLEGVSALGGNETVGVIVAGGSGILYRRAGGDFDHEPGKWFHRTRELTELSAVTNV